MSSAKIKKALRDSDLSTAISLLSNRINEIGYYDLKDAFDSTEATYRAMLTYMLQGYQDSEYVARREELIRSLFALNDQVDRYNRLASDDKQSRYYYAYRSVLPTTFEQIVQRLEVDLTPDAHERELCNLFNYVWTSNMWTKADYELASSLLNSDSISDNDKAVFISSITLGLMEMFDVRKLHVLFDAYLLPASVINQRALVGIILIVKIYDSRLECFPEIQSRLELYADDPRFVKEMYYALLMLQYSCISDRVSNKMVSDILPTLMSGNDQLKKMSPAELRSTLTLNGENPDWIDKKLEKGMNEMTKLVTEGADVHLSTFRYMKGYPFFNLIPHWFYPFDSKSPFLDDIEGIWKSTIGKFMSLSLTNGVFCNNDLYSFCFMLKSLHGKDKELLESQITEQITEEYIEEVDIKSQKKTISNKEICRQYIFDLYRFFFLYPFYNQFDNPFKMKKKRADGTEKMLTYSPLETKAFAFLLNNTDELQTLAEFYMRKEFYEEALEMYEVINPQQTEEEANIWQKIGFCKQKLGKEKSALKTYMLADSLLPDSKWTMTHIAQLAQKLEIYETAADYYELLLLQNGDNVKYIVNKAICQMKQGQYNEAITTLFKAHYLDEDSIDIRMMMIECYVLCGQLDKAKAMIDSVIVNNKCRIEIRILNALISMKQKSTESAYYCIREAMAFYDESENDGRSFTTLYNDVIKQYSDALDINPNLARMLLDSVKLDIR